jgi:C-terminal processing protease CtpA/Prc
MLAITPREEWRQMFTEAWRLERDYFYDTGMHGVNWKAMLDKYKPQVDRVATRAELSDLISQMVGELSALHIFVRGGDVRTGDDQVQIAGLGALLARVQDGYRVERVYQTDPDDPQLTAPLAKAGVDVRVGDVIESVNGVAAASVADFSALLRNQVGKQVLFHVKPATGEARDVIAVPVSQAAEADLRYHDWEYSRRMMVEEWGKGEIGYLHLRAMGGRKLHRVCARLLPGLHAQRPDHRRAPQPRREHRLLDPREAHAQGLVLLERTCRKSAGVEHAVRLPRPHGDALQRTDGIGRRGVLGRIQAAGPWKGDGHEDVGR